jgi:hypothetical protein
MLNELAMNIGTPHMLMAGLYGANKFSDIVGGRTIILIGASHMRRTAEALANTGHKVKLVETGHWRATKREVDKLLIDVKMTIGSERSDGVALVFCMTDNAFYLARAEDGSLLPHCRAIDGVYHMNGDVVCSPLDSSRQVFLQLSPMLKELQDFDKLLMVPLPRYMWSSCCDDPEHGANVTSEDHAETILHGLAAVQKLWRGMAFRDRLRNIKITNVSTQVADQEMWLDDGVHLVEDGYVAVARHITSGLEAMEARRTASEADYEQDASGGIKRARSGSREAAEPKRPLSNFSSGGCFVERNEQFGGRGRGRPFGGRFNRGGGWPMRGNHYRGNQY